MEHEFKVGDIVQLKFGAPAMTVSESMSSVKYWCEWFKGASKERGPFVADTLKLYVAPDADND